MRRIIASIVLVIGLVSGGLIAGTLPAEASTSHSNSYHCSITRPANSRVLLASSWTVVGGVTTRVRCEAQIFTSWPYPHRCWIVNAYTHTRGSYYAC
jgi:hypothetical protein